MSRVIAVGGSALLLLVAACASAPGERGIKVHDSAGVAVVEHGVALPVGIEEWSVEPVPVLSIGKVEGDEAYLFTRVVHAGMLPEGELLVADLATSDFRVFDSTGRFVRRFGRGGSGPGEFRELTWAGATRAGSITAFDARLRRVSRFSHDGTLREVFTSPSAPTGTPGYVVGQFDDGSLLIRSLLGLPQEEDLAKLSSGLVRDSIGLSLVSPDGSRTTSVGRFPGTQTLRVVGRVIGVAPPPFGLRTVMAVTDSAFYVGTQETYEVRAFRPTGDLYRVLRRHVPLQAVSAEAKGRWQEEWDKQLAGFKGAVPPHVTELAKHHRFPDALPSYGDLRVDQVGNLWVQEYSAFPNTDTVTDWVVFGPDGGVLARARLPKLQLTEIGTDHVVGVWRDRSDVPYVRVYRLEKRRRRGGSRSPRRRWRARSRPS